MPKSADQILREASELYAERNKVYGDNYLNAGAALSAFFPEGLVLKGANDFTRFHILMLEVVKMSRYCVNFSSGGHQDSVRDRTVYAAMLEAIDANILERSETCEDSARSENQGTAAAQVGSDFSASKQPSLFSSEQPRPHRSLHPNGLEHQG